MLSLIKKTVTDAAHTLPFAARRAGDDDDGDDDREPRTLASSGALVLDASTGAARALCVAPNATLVSASADGGLRAWDTASGRLMSHTKAFEEDGRGGALATARVGRDAAGRAFAACASTDGRVNVRDLTTGEVTVTFEGPTRAVEALCVLPMSGLVVGGDARGGIFVWDARGADAYPKWRFGAAARDFIGEHASANGTAESGPTSPVRKLVSFGKSSSGASAPERVRCVCGWVERDSRAEFVASGADDGTLTIWKMRVGRPIATFGAEDGGHRGAIHSVCDNDGVLVTAGADGRVLAWYVNEGGELLGPPEEMNVKGKHTGAVFNAVNIAPGIVCTAGADQRALVWDVRARRLMFECPSTKAGVVHSLAFDADVGVLYTGTASSQILRWELPSGDVLSPRGRDEELLLTRNLSTENLELTNKDGVFDGFAQANEEARAEETMERRVASSPHDAETLSTVEEKHRQELVRLRKALKDARDECLRLKQADKKRSKYVHELEDKLASRESSAPAQKADAAIAPEKSDDTELNALRTKCEKMETIARKQKAKLDELKGELKTVRDEHAAVLREKDAACEELSADLERAREELETSQRPEMSVEEMMAAAEKALESPAPAHEASQETLRELHAIREELQMAQQDASVAEKTISQLRSECEVLQVQLANTTNELQGLTSKADDFSDTEKRLTQERDNLSREVDVLSTTAKSRDKEIERLNTELSSTNDSADVVEALKTEHAAAMESLKKENADAMESMKKDNDAALEKLQTEAKQSKKKHEIAVKKGKAFQEEAAQLRRHLEDKAAELAAVAASNEQNDAEAALMKSTEECLALKRELEDARKSLTDAKTSAMAHEENIASMQRQIEELEASSRAAGESLRAREEELQAELASASDELATLNATVSAKDAEIHRISEHADKAKQKFDNAVKKGKGFQEEASRLRRELEEKSAELSAAIESKQQEDAQFVSVTNEELENLHAQIQSRDIELARMTPVMDTLQTQVATLEASLNAKDAEIQQLSDRAEKSKQKFENAVKKGKGFQEEVTQLREELEELETIVSRLTSSKEHLETQLKDAQNASSSGAEESRTLVDDLEHARARADELDMELAAQSAQSSNDLSKMSTKLDAANLELERARAELVTRDDERERLQSQLSSFNEAQQELAKLRESLGVYETEMDTLKSSVETAKTKFANAVKKGKSYQEEAVSLREQLAAKDFEFAQVSGTKGASETRIGELTLSLESANAKVRDGLLEVESKAEEVTRLAAHLRQSENRVEELERELEQSSRRANDDAIHHTDSRGQRWLEQQARAAVDERTRDLTEENERLRDEVAAANAAAAEAWQAAASHGVDRPGNSRAVSEIGSPMREGYVGRARSLYQQPSYRGGAMSMIHERTDLTVPKSEYDKLKELCVRLKRDLVHARQSAKDAVQQVINRLEIEVMAKVHAEAAAKSAQAECERAWNHAKDALATVQKNITAVQISKPISLAEALKPQPPPGTRAASALEHKSSNADALFVMRQEHLPSIIFAFLAFVVGMLLSKT